jgi:hypothetical protein
MESAGDRRFTLLTLVIVTLAAALVAGVGTWALMNARLADAEERTSLAEERIEELEAEVQELTEALETASDADDAAEGGGSADSGADETAASGTSAGPTEDDGRHFCYVTSALWEGEVPRLTVDYAQMLTGAEAAAAATAAGDESPPPNDYYIVNENPRLRSFPVDPSLTVRMTSTAEGTLPEGYDMAFGEWFDAYSGMSGAFPAIRDVPYWITIENGTIIAIEEQYLP